MRERAQQQAQSINNDFQVKIRPIIEAVAKEQGYDIVLDSQVTFLVSRDFDLTRDVIAKADQDSAAVPAASSAPASGPAPGPQRRGGCARRVGRPTPEEPALLRTRPRPRALHPNMSQGEIGRLVRRIPTQYPFVLVDRILEHDAEGRLVATKSVSGAEDFFVGHFPGQPVMPGVLLLESLAQAAGIWLLKAERIRAGSRSESWASTRPSSGGPSSPATPSAWRWSW